MVGGKGWDGVVFDGVGMVPAEMELYVVRSLASSRIVMAKEKVLGAVGEKSLISDTNCSLVEGIL